LNDYRYLVSAIVSTFNSERFIRGCLEDLTHQTLYKKGLLQIVIVNSGSEQGEEDIIREAQCRYGHILFLSTAREPLYASWNRAIRASSGKYLTNANTDDRHRQDAFEILCKQLDERTDIDLIYANCFVSKTPNEAFSQNSQQTLYRYPDFFAPAAVIHYQFGPQPMWRRSVHDRIGFFDESFKAAGDYDFNLRFALAGLRAFHVDEPLGLYLEHDNAISFKDNTMELENKRIAEKYKTAEQIVQLYRHVGASHETPEVLARIFVDAGNRALEYFPPWKAGEIERNPALACKFFREAISIMPDWKTPLNNLAFSYYLAGNHDLARQLLPSRSPETLELMPSGLQFPSQKTLSRLEIPYRDNTDAPDMNPQEPTLQTLSITFVASTGVIDPVESCGGLETALRETARACAQRGHRVAMVGTLHCQPGHYNGVEYIPFDDWKTNVNPVFSRDVDILAFASGPNIESYHYVGAQTARVALFHHQELKFLTGTNDPRKLLEEEADTIICVSQAVRNNLLYGGVTADRLSVVHNGYDPRVFYPRPVPRLPHRIIFAGALVPDKNPTMLIEAFLLKVLPLLPDAELHICGSASLWGTAEYFDIKKIAYLNPNIVYHGAISQNELAIEYSRATICVIPSLYESFSLVSLEAQACGCVPVVANVGGVPETLLHGTTGFIYDPNDTETLSQVILELFAAPARIAEASLQAIKHVSNSFSWRETARRYEEVFYTARSSRALKRMKLLNLKQSSDLPKVSVIITCYNYAHFLSEAVESVINQTFIDLEIIIVNDGSTDNTKEIASELIKKYPSFSIKLINQANSGHPAYSRNRGITEAAGAYVLPLDADDKIAPTMLAKCVALLDQDPTISIAYTDRLDFGGMDQIVTALDYSFDRLKYQNHISYCALFRKNVWEAVGGYKAIGCEDWNFWIEAGAHGHVAKRIPEPLFMYRRHDTGRFQRDAADFSRVTAAIVSHNRQLYSNVELNHALEILGISTPRVSVIVPTFNRPDFLRSALQSILAQTFRSFEIVVVNDAGVDVSDIVNALNVTNIQYICHDKNKGLAAARNTGIRAARGNFIAYLDDDDVFLPDHLEVLINFLESSKYRVAYTDACRVTQRMTEAGYVTVNKDYPYAEDFDYDRILTENFIPVLCIAHAKTCIDTVGGFDETLNRHEDWDLWIRMSRKYEFAHIRRVTCEYSNRLDGSSMVTGSVPAFLRTFEKICAKYNYITKNLPKILNQQKQRHYFMLYDTYYFLSQKLASLQDIASLSNPTSTIINDLKSLGATEPEAISAFYQQKALNLAESPLAAIPFFQKALQIAPENVMARQYLATILFQTGNHDMAIEHLHALLDINPFEPSILKSLALYYWGKNDHRAVEFSKRLLEQTPDDTEIRERVESYCASNLNDNKPITVAVFSLDSPEYACAQIRLLSPYQHLRQSIRYIWGATFNGRHCTTNLDAIAKADLIVVQRFYPRQGSLPYLEQMIASGKPIIYDLDDLITDVPDDHYLKPWIAETAEIFSSFLPKIDAVTVSTPLIASALKPFSHNIRVLPNLIDETIWRTIPPKNASDKTVIGFAGTATHQADMIAIESALFRIADKYGDKVIFRFMGDATPRLHSLPGFSFIPFAEDYQTYAHALGQAGFDISIIPLTNNSFNRAKSNIKWLEYSICGIPGIYANLPPYNSCIRQGETGILAGTDPNHWFEALSLLIDNPNLRQQIALNAQQEVLAHHTIRSGASRLLAIYRNVIAHRQCYSDRDPKVSVIIPVFNQLTLTLQCLDALRTTLTTETSCEIIVIDNASTDGTDVSLKTQPIRYFRNHENLGFATACNQGARAARGEFLLFLNNDTIPRPGWLQPLVQALATGEAQVCGARLLYPDGRCQHAGIAFDDRGLGYHIFANFPGDAPAVMERRPMQAVTGACLAIGKELFTELEGFDEGFRNGFEDVDLCLRAGARGKQILYLPESVVIHYAEQSTGRKDHDLPNMQRFFSRWQGKIRCDDQELYRRFGFSSQREGDGRIIVTPLAKAAPAVSIIIPLFNQAQLTRNCLAALERQTPAGLYEVILVDNGSTDATAELLATWNGTAAILRNPDNRGFAAACNQGARAATGRFLLFLNNDTEVMANWLQPLIACLDHDPLAAAAGSKLLYPDGTIQHAGVIVVDDQTTGDPLLAKHQYLGLPAEHPPANRRAQVQALTAACLLVRRDAFSAVGGFDEGYWNGYEDVDLCFKLAAQGWHLIYEPASVVRHYESKSGPERFRRARQNIERLHHKWLGKVQPAAIITASPMNATAAEPATDQVRYPLVPLVGQPASSPLQRLASSTRLRSILQRYTTD
jgi:GT2 family glycosyltransferase/glycosyltransferase involved in cell wall biosynthesis